jgi:hypothetical protein
MKKWCGVNRPHLPIFEATQLEVEMSGTGMATFSYIPYWLSRLDDLARSDSRTE